MKIGAIIGKRNSDAPRHVRTTDLSTVYTTTSFMTAANPV
jgi:hypothetical protein